MKKTFALLVPFCATLFTTALPSAAFASSPVYVGLSGRVTGLNQDQVLAELKARVTEPLAPFTASIKTYFSYVADGSAHFSLGLITEATRPEGEATLASYTHQLEQQGFHGLPVHFYKVTGIREDVVLQAGLHRAGTDDGAFDPDNKVRKTFALTSVRQWETFTDKLGDAFLSKTSADFLGYLAQFLGGDEYFQVYAQQVLAHDNVVLGTMDPTIQLEGGGTIGTDSEGTPFFNMPFVRKCWAPDFEHGMCYPPAS